MKACYMAVHTETGEYFGGKRNRTHIGYPKKNFLKAAMTNAQVNHEDYYIIMLTFDDLTPKITLVEGNVE